MISHSVPLDFTIVEHFGQHVCKGNPFSLLWELSETGRRQRGADHRDR
jgi:hypothetical protein